MSNPTPGAGGWRPSRSVAELRAEFLESLAGFVGENSLASLTTDLDELIQAAGDEADDEARRELGGI